MKYCSNCGHRVTFGEVSGEDLPRYHCNNCGMIHYQNPNMIVGCLPRWEDKILLCKRAIEPRKNKWTLPAGFLETGETVEAGAMRETKEEAAADVEIVRLFSIYSLKSVGQVYLMFLADLVDGSFGVGRESLEVQLFRPEEIPWNDLAFSAIRFTLEKYVDAHHAPCEVYMGTHAWK